MSCGRGREFKPMIAHGPELPKAYKPTAHKKQHTAVKLLHLTLRLMLRSSKKSFKRALRWGIPYSGKKRDTRKQEKQVGEE